MCDNVDGISAKYKKLLRMSENAFKAEASTTILTCEEILRNRFLDFEEIAKEIVESLGKECYVVF